MTAQEVRIFEMPAPKIAFLNLQKLAKKYVLMLASDGDKTWFAVIRYDVWGDEVKRKLRQYFAS